MYGFCRQTSYLHIVCNIGLTSRDTGKLLHVRLRDVSCALTTNIILAPGHWDHSHPETGRAATAAASGEGSGRTVRLHFAMRAMCMCMCMCFLVHACCAGDRIFSVGQGSPGAENRLEKEPSTNSSQGEQLMESKKSCITTMLLLLTETVTVTSYLALTRPLGAAYSN